MNFRLRLNQLWTPFMLIAAGHPVLARAQASAPDSGKGEIICTYLRAPPGWERPEVVPLIALLAFLAFCAVVVLIQSSRRNRVLEEQVVNLMKANARELPGNSNRY